MSADRTASGGSSASIPRGAGWWFAPLRPGLIGAAALGVALLIATRSLPLHTILIWSSSGREGLAASRSDLQITALVAAFVVLAVWLVASAIMAIIPARHVLVPHAEFWKSGGKDRVREMRHRFGVYLSRAIGLTFWFLAAEVMVAVVSQTNGVLESPWLPVIVSLLYIISLLVFAVWVFADGFQPTMAARRR